MEEYEWEVGMKVVVYGYGGNRSLSEIVSVTKGGKCKIKGSNNFFRKTGTEVCNDVWYRRTIQPATEEMIKEMVDESFVRRCVYRMQKTKTSDITLEQASAIWKILTGGDEHG